MLDNDTPFDLEKVREICIKLTLRYPARELIDDVYQCALAGQVLPSALDEILRLQSNNQEQLKIIECLYKLMHAEAKSYAKLTSLQCNALGVIRDAYEEQAKRIVELEQKLLTSECRERDAGQRIAELESAYKIFLTANENTIKFEKKTTENIITALSMYEELERTIDRQRAALKKLGKRLGQRGRALVEERINGKFSNWILNNCPHLYIEDEAQCSELNGIPCKYRDGKCPISAKLYEIARNQLRREEKL